MAIAMPFKTTIQILLLIKSANYIIIVHRFLVFKLHAYFSAKNLSY